MEFFFRLYEVLFVGFSLLFSLGFTILLGVWVISFEGDIKFFELLVRGLVFFLLLFIIVFLGDFFRIFENKI